VPNNARGMVATNSVEFPFSVHGGRRSQEVVEKNVLKPYVVNGKFFKCVFKRARTRDDSRRTRSNARKRSRKRVVQTLRVRCFYSYRVLTKVCLIPLRSIAMRQQLVDWMDEQHSELSLTEETLHLAIRYVDTFLSQRVPDVFLQRHGSGSEPVPCAPLKELNGKRVLYSMDVLNPLCNKLKRLGITCVFVAAKVTEVTTPSAVEFARYADVSSFTREQLLLAERALLRELNYSLIRPTAFSFAEAYVESANSALLRYADRFDFDPRRFNADFSTREDLFREMTYYFVELAAVAHDSLGFSPSLLGAAAVASALRRFKINFDEVPMLREVAGYCDKELEGAVEFLKNLTRDAWMIQEYGEGLTVNRKYESVAEFLSDECSKC